MYTRIQLVCVKLGLMNYDNEVPIEDIHYY